MYKILITFSVALLICGLSNGWPFSGGAAEEGNPCVDVYKKNEKECSEMVGMKYVNSTMAKRVAEMEKKKDMDGLIMSYKKFECCVGFAVIDCIEIDVKVI